MLSRAPVTQASPLARFRSELAALLVLVLEGEGYPVTVASDAAGAIDEVKKEATDLVVLDISLGADDGRMVLSQIRERGQRPVAAARSHDAILEHRAQLKLRRGRRLIP